MFAINLSKQINKKINNNNNKKKERKTTKKTKHFVKSFSQTRSKQSILN